MPVSYNHTMEGSSHPAGDQESPSSTTTDKTKRGGWITFPFIITATAGMTVASGGWVINLIVYLIKEYGVKSIEAAQISNLVNGFTSLIPVLAAIIADSFAGCFSLICFSSFFSILGIVFLFITTMFHSSTSQQCDENGSCETPSKSQFAILYVGIALATLGTGGTRTTLSTMGADQYNKSGEQSIFFNWFFFTWYIATLIATTAIVYVEDNVAWSWGFGLCAVLNVFGLAIFLAGIKLYRHVKPKGSPFTVIACVIVAAIRKREVLMSTDVEDYYHGDDAGGRKVVVSAPTKSFRFLNRAAFRTEGDTKSDGSIAKPWNLCTVEQVEDLKTVIKIAPLWTSSTFLHTPIAIQASLSILQALTMDRHIGSHFQIPAGSILVFVLISTAICLTVFDPLLRPTWKYLIGRPLTPLQRIGIGHVLNVTSMALSAIVEAKRLGVAHSKKLETKSAAGSVVPMSVLWLVPQLVFVGLGEAFHYPGQTALYYQEFPKSLKALATALISLIIAVAYYLSTALVDLVRRVTEWLPDDLNRGRLDLVYWSLVVIGVLNFGYFLVCAWLYKYQVKMVSHDDDSSST